MTHRRTRRLQRVFTAAASFVVGSTIALIAAQDVSGLMGVLVYVVVGAATALGIYYVIEAIIRRTTG
jgi:hypothetical protein